MVQTGYVLAVGFGPQSKHSVTSCERHGVMRQFHYPLVRYQSIVQAEMHHLTLSKGCTWPRYPAVPDSTSGIRPAMHILFTCLRASAVQHAVSTRMRSRRLFGGEFVFTQVIERVQDEIKLFEPLNIELWLFDVAMYWMKMDVRVEGTSSLCCYL
jgi:hypothetical protein